MRHPTAIDREPEIDWLSGDMESYLRSRVAHLEWELERYQWEYRHREDVTGQATAG